MAYNKLWDIYTLVLMTSHFAEVGYLKMFGLIFNTIFFILLGTKVSG